MKQLLVTGLLCTVIGLAVGAIFASRAPTATSLQVEKHTVREVPGVDKGELATIVRHELARERARPPVAQVPAPVETADEARAQMSDEQLDHAETAAQVLRSAVSRGQWTIEDRSALVAQMTKLPAAVQAEIGGQLAVALNKGELTMEGDWLPL